MHKILKIIEDYGKELEKVPGIKYFLRDDFDSYGVNIFIGLEDKYKIAEEEREKGWLSEEERKKIRKEKVLINTVVKRWFRKILNKAPILEYNKEGNYYYADYEYAYITPNYDILEKINEGLDIIKEIRKEIWLSKIFKVLDIKGRKKKQKYIQALDRFFEENYEEDSTWLDIDVSENPEKIETYIKQHPELLKEKVENNKTKTNKVYLISPADEYIPEDFKNDKIKELVVKLANESSNIKEHLLKIANKFPNKHVDVFYFYVHGDVAVITEEEKEKLGYYGRFDTIPIIAIGNSEKDIKNAFNELKKYILEAERNLEMGY